MHDAINQTAAPSATESEFQKGWPVLFASVLGIAFSLAAMPFYTMGVFAPHLAREFGWTTAEIMGGLTVTTLMVLWAAPLVGVLAERIGVRRVVIASQILFGLSMMSLALTNGSLVQFYGTWAAVAIFGAGTLPITWTRAVNNWFNIRKGLALGLAMTGTGLFGILCKPYLAWLIGSYGWRAAYVGLGILPLIIALPATLKFFHDREVKTAAGSTSSAAGGMTVAEALRDWRFWLIALSLLPLSFALSGTVPNLEAILTEAGIPAARIIALTPLIGLSAILGRLAGGWLLDRFWAPAVAFAILALPALSYWLLAVGGLSFGSAAFAILLIGFALGIEYDVVAYFTARYFGLAHYSAIYAILYVCFASGSGVSAMVFGWDRDQHGGFGHILTISAILVVVCAGSFLLLGRYRNFDGEPQQ